MTWDELNETQGMWSEGLGTPVMSATEVMGVMRSFGMGKFAAAVMWVLQEAFENEECRIKKQRSATEGKANEECSDADEFGEQQLFTHYQSKEEFIKLKQVSSIGQQLKEIGPQADSKGRQQEQLKITFCPQADGRSEQVLINDH